MTSIRIYYKPLFIHGNILEGWMITPVSYDHIHKSKIMGPRNIYSLEEVSRFPKTVWKEVHEVNRNTPALAILLWSI